ncbi:polar amino acid transport system substrate-binding protein [Franzmannia pantelleriensis]|uniref:Polar amino acid transport system substrate-binding protein n=1 Tax=Franzmannia pantelleriensis TaxID=48727 RepID=A0A1G9RVD8_9GAMM|nr:transporter substrate-binding domain-containing protein [Halomonas pantelleriensis]SDM26990.1 polar amino acid transport system substrate-binding protein [Halomonas pantelleriensis]
MIARLILALCLILPLTSALALERLTFITEEYPPYNYRHDGRLEGIAIEVLEALFEATDTPLDRDAVRYFPWARGYDIALTEPDTVLFSTTRTEQREALFQWVGPIARDSVTLLARRDSGIRLDDLDALAAQDYRIAVIREDIGAQRLIEGGVSDDQLRPAISNLSALKMLEHGRVDLWAYSQNVAFWLMEQHDIDTRYFEPVYTLSESDLYFAVHRDTDSALVEAMQTALDALERQGQLARLTGSEVTFTTEEYPPFNYLDGDRQIDGLATRILQRALADTSHSASFRLMPWARAITEARLRDNHCAYSTSRTPAREAQFNWVGPLASNRWAAFVTIDSPLMADGLDELAGLTVGSFREDAVGQHVEARGIPITVASQERDNIQRLTAGLIDVWVTGELTGRVLAAEANVELRKLFDFHDVELYLACHPSVSATFLSDLQRTLDDQRRAGVNARIEAEVLDTLGVAP